MTTQDKLPPLAELLRKRRRPLASELRMEIGAAYLCCRGGKVRDIAHVERTDDGPTLNGSSWEEGEGLAEFRVDGWDFFLDASAAAGADIRDVLAPYDALIRELQAENERLRRHIDEVTVALDELTGGSKE